MFENYAYEKLLAIAVMVVIFWIGLILYRVGREGVIKQVDFWKSKWKIVLFWFVILVLAMIVLYYLNKYGVLDSLSAE